MRTELGSWRRAWRRVGKAEVEVEVDADMAEEKLEEEAEEAEEEEDEAEEEAGRRRATALIKSNNPHLAGGEKMRSLAELLASFLTLLSAKLEEVSLNCCVFDVVKFKN